MEERTRVILGLIEDNGFTISGLEKELGYSNGAFKVRDGHFSKKVLDVLEVYFEIVKSDKVLEEGLPDGDEKLIRRWGNNRVPWTDGVYRFRDVYVIKGDENFQDNGLWKRYDDWGYIGTNRSRERTLKKGWSSTGNILEDSFGEYIMLENGIKLYSCDV